MHTGFYFTLITVMKLTYLLRIDPARYERIVTDINTESNYTLFKLITEMMCFIVLLCSSLSYVVVHHGLIVFQHACLVLVQWLKNDQKRCQVQQNTVEQLCAHGSMHMHIIVCTVCVYTCMHVGTGKRMLLSRTCEQWDHPWWKVFLLTGAYSSNGTTLSSQSRALKQNWVLSPTTRTAEPPDDKMLHWLTKSNKIKLKRKKKKRRLKEKLLRFVIFCLWGRKVCILKQSLSTVPQKRSLYCKHTSTISAGHLSLE